jgi:hypothetical protein
MKPAGGRGGSQSVKSLCSFLGWTRPHYQSHDRQVKVHEAKDRRLRLIAAARRRKPKRSSESFSKSSSFVDILSRPLANRLFLQLQVPKLKLIYKEPNSFGSQSLIFTSEKSKMTFKARIHLRKENLVSFLSLVCLLLHLSVCCQASLGPPRKRTNHPSFRTTSNLLVRGGQQASDPYNANANANANANNGQSQPYDNYANNNNNNYDQNTPPQPQSYNHEDEFANVDAGFNEPDQLFQETVQDRVDKWRTSQMEKSKTYTALQAANPRDDQGRMKLMSTVSKGSRAFIFFVLMWRDIHLYEIADQHLKCCL